MKKLHFFVLVLAFVCSNQLFPFGSHFIENKGQITDWEGRVRNDILYYADINSSVVYVTKYGLIFVEAFECEESENEALKPTNLRFPALNTKSCTLKRTDLIIPDLGLMNHSFKNKSEAYYNFYLSNSPDGIINTHSFESVGFESSDNGIRLTVSLNDPMVSIFVHPGNNRGSAYSLYESIKKSISSKNLDNCCSVLFDSEAKDTNNEKINGNKTQGIAFDVVYASFFGMHGDEGISSMQIDSGDNIYIGGYTTSNILPVTEGCFQGYKSDTFDIFLAKFDKYHSLIWCTYLGGKDIDHLADICFSQYDNSLWICGSTRSNDFPVTANAYQKKFKGGRHTGFEAQSDGILGNLSSKGYMNFLTYFGGIEYESLDAIAAGPGGDAYICSGTSATDFPITENAKSKYIKGFTDAVLVHFDRNYNLIYSSFWGGTGYDAASDISVDNDGNIIITGDTDSGDYYTTDGKKVKDEDDVFITKFDKNFKVIWSTLYGGSSSEDAQFLSVDRENNTIITGYSYSNDLLITPGVYKINSITYFPRYAAKFNDAGNVIWSTYLGGPISNGHSVTSNIGELAIGRDGSIVFSFLMEKGTLPTHDSSISKKVRGAYDTYILILDRNCQYLYSTYYGGYGRDWFGSFVFNSKSNLIAAGWSTSPDFYTTPDAFQRSKNGGRDGYIFELGTNKDTCDESAFEYPDFHEAESINFSGKARPGNNTITLTDAAANRVGAAWHRYFLPVKKGFSTEFSFRISEGVKGEASDNSNPGADGIAFVLQNINPDTVGDIGGKIGYDKIPNSLAIEFDLFSNDDKQIENLGDPNSNHIAVMTKGKEPNSSDHNSGAQIAIADSMMELKSDGTVYYARVDYNIEPAVLSVFLSDKKGTFSKPVIELKDFELQKFIELFEDEWAYAGFTSSTGSSYQKHEILSWKFCPKPTYSTQTGIEENILNQYTESMIYPNPAGDVLYVNTGCSQCKTISIYSLSGDSIRAYQLSGRNSKIDISDLPVGIWFVKIESGHGNIVFEKFVKK